MKLIGLIGGVSTESTIIYYELLNKAARAHLGGQHSANIMFYALDYGVIIKHYQAGNWAAYAGEVAKGAEHLKRAGVKALAITSNTSHVGAEAAAKATGLPVIHVLDSLTAELNRQTIKKPLLLGTPFVMGGDFYLPALKQRFNGDVIAPDATGQELVGRIILDELVDGVVNEASRKELIEMTANYDCDGIVLGCTELCMILEQQHFDLPVLDTTALHAADVSRASYAN